MEKPVAEVKLTETMSFRQHDSGVEIFDFTGAKRNNLEP